MAYKIVAHQQRGNTRIVAVDTGTLDNQGMQVVESFSWGMDVPLATVRRETKALLDAKYGAKAVTLAGVGTDL